MEYTAITIVSDMSATIRERITGDLGRGVTIYRGYGGMRGTEQDILYCVVTRLEVGKVRAIVPENSTPRLSWSFIRWPAPRAAWSRSEGFTKIAAGPVGARMELWTVSP